MPKSYDNLLVREQGAVAIVTINRAQALNALNAEVMADLQRFFAGMRTRRDIRAVVVTGNGEKAFVAGADIAYMQGMSPAQARDWARFGQEVYDSIAQSPQIVIAAVNGYALGGGCELMLACDIRIAGEGARIGQPEVKLGIIPGFGGTQRLPGLVGKGMAKLLLCTGDMIDAQQALTIGLVEKVVPREELMNEAVALAERLSKMPAASLSYIKQLVNASDQLPHPQGAALEAESMGLCFSTADKAEGMAAFLEKREAKFQ
jgi:enoyl-CoA hydratase